MNKATTGRSLGNKIGIVILAFGILVALIYAGITAYFSISAKTSEEICTDVNEYDRQRRGDDAIDNFSARGMDEIWPEEITDRMDVQDYFMMSYSPWDANYLGYLVVDYAESDYVEETTCLGAYASTDYVGNYGATGFADYEVLAMNADDEGFVYAITDGVSRIIYVEMIFPGYGMDIAYEEYVPEKYLPEGLDAATGNPTQQEKEEQYEKTKN